MWGDVTYDDVNNERKRNKGGKLVNEVSEEYVQRKDSMVDK